MTKLIDATQYCLAAAALLWVAGWYLIHPTKGVL